MKKELLIYFGICALSCVIALLGFELMCNNLDYYLIGLWSVIIFTFIAIISGGIGVKCLEEFE